MTGTIALQTLFLLFTLSGHGFSDSQSKTVHLVFMNHLDVGYDGLGETPGFINNVLNKYFTEYFPRAVNIALELEFFGYAERFVYTTHPWLISFYLNCPPNLSLSGVKLACPNVTEQEMFKKAIRHGYIAWHAGPMNMQPEIMDSSLFEFGLRLSADLDKQFNMEKNVRVLSQRDVPGMTQAVIPLLVKNNVQAVSVGVNSATAPPAVPKIFNWVFKNESVIGLWHPGGYPNNPGTLPRIPGGLSRKDCVTHPGMDDVLCFAFRTDNSGPPQSIAEVLMCFEIARAQYPGFYVKGSTLENFVTAALEVKSLLPVVDLEMGDTWIEGVSSDPRKVAEMRIFMRLLSACLDSQRCSLKDPRVYNASRFLLKSAEHTWGISSVFDTIHWTNQQFYPLYANKNFQNGVSSWREQRSFAYLAVDALQDHPLANAILDGWKTQQVSPPDLVGYKKLSDTGAQIECENDYKFQFSSEGHLIRLFDPQTKINWATKDFPIARFVYQTLNQSDFDYFNKYYPYSKQFFLGIGKPNITNNTDAQSQIWDTILTELYQRNASDCSFMFHVKVKDPTGWTYYGAPRSLWFNYTVQQTGSSAGLRMEVQWFNKTTTRLPEALYMVVSPLPIKENRWFVHKMNQYIDPLKVMNNGSQRLHAVDKGVYYVGERGGGLEILSPDVALVNVLTPDQYVSPIPLPLTPLGPVAGVAFNIYNNIWNVNYVNWYPYLAEDNNYKFTLFLNFFQGGE